jgi:hypothetical protein
MDIFDWLARRANDTFKKSHTLETTVPSAIGYNGRMVQRPVIGVGNAPQYWPDMQAIARNSIAGGGTIAGNPPASGIGGPLLDWQTHTFGGPVQRGTITPSRQLTGLAPQSLVIKDRR